MINNKSKNPLLSVVMPAYNTQNYIAEAILSVVNQTFQDFELLIIDDASTDNTVEIIKKLQSKYHKIKLIQLKLNQNCGGDKCANVGLVAATGKYIARMDADDISEPKRFEKQIKFMEKNPGVFLVGSNANVINSKGKIIGEKNEPLASKDIYKSYFGFHPLIHPTCMFRRILKNGKSFEYEIKYSANNDYYTFFRLICNGYKFVNLEEKLLKYRIHDHNATYVNVKEKFVNSLKIRLSMILNQGYRPSLKNLILLAVQTLVVMVLPERLLLKIYFIAKGIIKKEDILPSLSLPTLKNILAFK